MTTTNIHNVDPAELAKFDALAARWWDPEGEFRPLHQINPLRLDWIRGHVELDGRKAVDIGCGGGILAEAMAARGARVTGLDASEAALSVGRLHGHESGVRVEYLPGTAETLAAQRGADFDVVTCMELLEHVPDVASLVDACARLARPGGTVVFSTINRTVRAWLGAVVGAEYLLGLLPRGTHEYARMLRPSELDGAARRAGLALVALTGLGYNPFTGSARLGRDVGVNYLAAYRARAQS